METVTGFDLNMAWLFEPEYAVKALCPDVACFTQQLKEILRKGCVAEADSCRPGFYQIDLSGKPAYIYVRDETSTVYLVAVA